MEHIFSLLLHGYVLSYSMFYPSFLPNKKEIVSAHVDETRLLKLYNRSVYLSTDLELAPPHLYIINAPIKRAKDSLEVSITFQRRKDGNAAA